MQLSTNRRHRERGPVEYWSKPEDEPLITYANPSVITIGPGCLRDAENSKWLEWDSTLTASLTVSGPGGLDTGSEASNTWYYPWIIGRGNGLVRAILSTSATAPSLPAGYWLKKRLKIAIRNDNSSNIVEFYKVLNTIYYSDYAGNYKALAAGQSTSWADVDCSAYVPPQSRIAKMYLETEAASGVFNRALFRTKGTGDAGRSAGVPANNTTGNKNILQTDVILNASQVFEYQVSDANTVFRADVVGYVWTDE